MLHVSTYERRGGAEQVARSLFEAYRRLGHRSYLAVGRGPATDPGVLPLSQGNRRIAHILAGPGRLFDRWLGLESCRYPGSRNLPDLVDDAPDIVHLHNLHGGYFDLRVLPELGRRCPTVLTLHDAWLLSGHCAHSFDCERWRSGCGECPDLSIYPAIRRDATAANWRRKRDILARSGLHIATPSVWLMQRVSASLIAQAACTTRVIPNGVDLSVFSPDDSHAARDRLGLRVDGHLVLVAGSALRTNPFKDWPTVRRAVSHAAEALNANVMLVALGDRGESERAGRVQVDYVPFERDPATVADYYRAADVYLHAAHADTFPNTVIEALACGTPVVATAVGGVPEQVNSLEPAAGVEAHRADTATGVLVAEGDAPAMGRALTDLLERRRLRQQLAANAAADARARFDFMQQRDAYLAWYYDLLEARDTLEHRAAPSTSRGPASSPS